MNRTRGCVMGAVFDAMPAQSAAAMADTTQTASFLALMRVLRGEPESDMICFLKASLAYGKDS